MYDRLGKVCGRHWPRLRHAEDPSQTACLRAGWVLRSRVQKLRICRPCRSTQLVRGVLQASCPHSSRITCNTAICSILAEHGFCVLHPADGSTDQLMDRAAEGSVGDPGNADDAIIIEDDVGIQDVDPQVIQPPLALPASGVLTCRLMWPLQPQSVVSGYAVLIAPALCCPWPKHFSEKPEDLVADAMSISNKVLWQIASLDKVCHIWFSACKRVRACLPMPSILSSSGTPTARLPCWKPGPGRKTACTPRHAQAMHTASRPLHLLRLAGGGSSLAAGTKLGADRGPCPAGHV